MGVVVVGSPATVVDEMERWIEVADVDGFNLAYATTPGTFEDLVELVVPELRRRGLVPEQYETSTLREHLYGPGQVRVRDDHPAAAHRAGRRTTPTTPDSTPQTGDQTALQRTGGSR
jgi:hypothetical protein